MGRHGNPVPVALPDAAVGLGTLAVDLGGAVLLTSILRNRLGFRAWRAVHWLAYLAWPAAFLHALRAGGDLHTRMGRGHRLGIGGGHDRSGGGPPVVAGPPGVAVRSLEPGPGWTERVNDAEPGDYLPRPPAGSVPGPAVLPRLLREAAADWADPASLREHLARHRHSPVLRR